MPLLEWFANNYKKFGATLEIVTDKSQEGSQFVKGFGGIGGEHIVVYDTRIVHLYNIKLGRMEDMRRSAVISFIKGFFLWLSE